MRDLKEDIEQIISEVVEKIKNIGGEKVRFIVLYGSVIKRKMTNLSDIDLAVFYDDNKYERFKFRTKILGRIRDGFDIQTFQDLPLYIQKDIISTGKVIYFSDYKEIFKIYMKTIKEFEHFKPRLELYYSKIGV